ncbi:hypothetical protein HUN39_09890 [Methylocystis sp. FS]|uniref:hypothetical protein n=1 Tax=Methylocystis silviterrae TaxID=2743612 RepID=UPI0015844630|nr:hypothetical protein [Methylocystis silviterrae]NUJ80337.1 hypothetical protein [Methylocystis silviterrae]
MNRLLIAAFALGAFGLTQSEVLARPSSPVRLTQTDHRLMQRADDRDQDMREERGDYWGRGGDRMWRDTRPWSDEEWRRNPNLDDNVPDNNPTDND